MATVQSLEFGPGPPLHINAKMNMLRTPKQCKCTDILGYGTFGAVMKMFVQYQEHDYENVAAKFFLDTNCDEYVCQKEDVDRIQLAIRECDIHSRLSTSPETGDAVVPVRFVGEIADMVIWKEVIHALQNIVGKKRLSGKDFRVKILRKLIWHQQHLPVTVLGTQCGKDIERVRASRLDADSLIVCSLHMCYAVARLNQAGWFHADLKPWNYVAVPCKDSSLLDLAYSFQVPPLRLVDHYYRVCLLDFGSAKEIDPVSGKCTFGKFHPTTKHFRAPETLFAPSDFYTEKEEVWALGCTVMYLIARVVPYVAYLQCYITKRLQAAMDKVNPVAIEIIKSFHSEFQIERQADARQCIWHIVGMMLLFGPTSLPTEWDDGTNPWIVRIWNFLLPYINISIDKATDGSSSRLFDGLMDMYAIPWELRNLLLRMLALHPSDRPGIMEVLEDPLFRRFKH